MLSSRSCWRRAWLHSYEVIYNNISISHQCCPLTVTSKAKSASLDSINGLLRQADLAWISLITHWKSSWILHRHMRWGRLNAWGDELNVPIENDFHSVWWIMHFLLLMHVIASLIWHGTDGGIPGLLLLLRPDTAPCITSVVIALLLLG